MKLKILVVAGVLLISGGLCAQTQDGQTPADEDVCNVYSGTAFGLCNAYCEALDCDSPESQNYGQNACITLLSRFEILTGQGLPLCVDMDSDGITNSADNCPGIYNPGQEDADADGVGDACDNCPGIYNPGQEDADANGIGDACEVQQAACPCWDEENFQNTFPPTEQPDYGWPNGCTAGHQGTILLENLDKPYPDISTRNYIFQAWVTSTALGGGPNSCNFTNFPMYHFPDLHEYDNLGPSFYSYYLLSQEEVDACVESIKRQARAHAIPGVAWDCWPE